MVAGDCDLETWVWEFFGLARRCCLKFFARIRRKMHTWFLRTQIIVYKMMEIDVHAGVE